MNPSRLSWMSEGGLADAFDGARESGDLVVEQIKAGVRAELLGGPVEHPQIARFVILEPIGAGAMGRVYAAYDPSLDRRVALKVLRSTDAGARARVLAEARALARLSEPNVVTVHEVGEVDGQPWIAMECVEGRSLREVLESDAPKQATIVELFVAAGRGLAAAHAAGIIHRDFKPANVVVGDDGRVRVADFGLATAIEEAAAGGSLAGTPLYMAPEQKAGLPVEPASDQYSFCVALWEALTGEVPAGPFTASSPATEVAAAAMPSRVRGLLHRGLRREPADRWPDMNTLLAELQPDPVGAARRTVRRGAALGLVGLSAGGVVMWTAWADRPVPCTGAAAAIAEVWTPTLAGQLEESFARSGSTLAPQVWARVGPALDAYAGQWVEQHTEACQASTVRGEQSQASMDLRMACLRRAKLGLDATVTVFAEADGATVRRADAVLRGLPPLDRCQDADELAREIPLPDPAIRSEVEAMQESLAEATAVRLAGQGARARELMSPLRARARALGYLPLTGELALQHARAIRATGDYEGARQALEEAMQSGLRSGARRTTIDAATELVVVAGTLQQQPRAAHAYAAVAEGLIDPSRDQPAQAQLHRNLADMLVSLKQYDEARAHADRALEIAVSGSLDPRTVAVMRSTLANVLDGQGDHQGAMREYGVAAEVLERAFGTDHPATASVRLNFAAALLGAGRYDEGAAELRLSIAALAAALGSGNPTVGQGRSNLGGALVALGRNDEAIEELRAALDIYATALPPGHPVVASARSNLGQALEAKGQLQLAEAEYRAVAKLIEDRRGGEHAELVMPWHNLGRVLIARGEVAAGRALLDDAVAVGDKELGPEHPSVAAVRHEIAVDLLKAEPHSEEAVALLRRAWAVRGRPGGPADARGDTAFALARALPPGDEARELARSAVAAYRDAGPRLDEARARVSAWLEEH